MIYPLVSVARGEKPTEEAAKNLMQNLANNLMDERYDKEKGNAAPCFVSDGSSNWLDINIFSFKHVGLTADQWKRIDEIHSTLMRERRMQQKPGAFTYCSYSLYKRCTHTQIVVDRLRSIVASDQLRIEEERRQRELSEKKRVHRLEEERKKRQAGEALPMKCLGNCRRYQNSHLILL